MRLLKVHDSRKVLKVFHGKNAYGFCLKHIPIVCKLLFFGFVFSYMIGLGSERVDLENVEKRKHARKGSGEYGYEFHVLVGSFKATLNLADRDLGFVFCSCDKATIGFFVIMEREGCVLKKFFTILSSNEWKDMTAILPLGSTSSTAWGNASLMFSSSLFTAMRSAWNVLVAACILFLWYHPGVASWIILIS